MNGFHELRIRLAYEANPAFSPLSPSNTSGLGACSFGSKVSVDLCFQHRPRSFTGAGFFVANHNDRTIHEAVENDLPGDFDGPPDRDELVARARRQFPGFYISASADDMEAMDTLVILRAALWPVLNVPREHVAEIVRRGLELATNATEQAFAQWRDAVRNSATFARLSPDEQREIEREVFEIRAGPGS